MKYLKGLLMVLLLITLVACGDKEDISYEIVINDDAPTSYLVGDEVDFKKYFVITDSLGNNVTVLDEMVDSTDVNLSEAGSYVVKINYEGVERQVTITVELPPEELTYTITVNDELPTTFDVNSEDVDFKKYFVITDSKGNNVTVLDEMVDSTDVNLNEAGSYVVKISFEGLEKQVTINVELPPEELTYTITVND